MFFSHDKYSTNTINDKSIDGVVGTRTWGGRMVGTDESTELWQPTKFVFFALMIVSLVSSIQRTTYKELGAIGS